MKVIVIFTIVGIIILVLGLILIKEKVKPNLSGDSYDEEIGVEMVDEESEDEPTKPSIDENQNSNRATIPGAENIGPQGPAELPTDKKPAKIE